MLFQCFECTIAASRLFKMAKMSVRKVGGLIIGPDI
jgi:hypothetical protein